MAQAEALPIAVVAAHPTYCPPAGRSWHPAKGDLLLHARMTPDGLVGRRGGGRASHSPNPVIPFIKPTPRFGKAIDAPFLAQLHSSLPPPPPRANTRRVT